MESDGIMNFDIQKIKKYLRNRYPFLMIDYVKQVVPGVSAVAYKNISVNEWQFQGHFPDYPVMPGALLLEAMFNTAALAIHTIDDNEENLSMISRVKEASFYKEAVPGDVLRIKAEIVSYKRGIGKANCVITCKEDIVAKAEIILSIPKKITKLRGELNGNDE